MSGDYYIKRLAFKVHPLLHFRPFLELDYDVHGETIVQDRVRRVEPRPARPGYEVRSLGQYIFEWREPFLVPTPPSVVGKIDNEYVKYITNQEDGYYFIYLQRSEGRSFFATLHRVVQGTANVVDAWQIMLDIKSDTAWITGFGYDRFRVKEGDNEFEIKIVAANMEEHCLDTRVCNNFVLLDQRDFVLPRPVVSDPRIEVGLVPEKVCFFDVETVVFGEARPWSVGWVVAEMNVVKEIGVALLEEGAPYLVKNKLKPTHTSDQVRNKLLDYQKQGYFLVAKGNALEFLFMVDQVPGMKTSPFDIGQGVLAINDNMGRTWLNEPFAILDFKCTQYENLWRTYEPFISLEIAKELRQILLITGLQLQRHVPAAEALFFFQHWVYNYERAIQESIKFEAQERKMKYKYWDRRISRVSSEFLPNTLTQQMQFLEFGVGQQPPYFVAAQWLTVQESRSNLRLCDELLINEEILQLDSEQMKIAIQRYRQYRLLLVSHGNIENKFYTMRAFGLMTLEQWAKNFKEMQDEVKKIKMGKSKLEDKSDLQSNAKPFVPIGILLKTEKKEFFKEEQQSLQSRQNGPLPPPPKNLQQYREWLRGRKLF